MAAAIKKAKELKGCLSAREAEQLSTETRKMQGMLAMIIADTDVLIDFLAAKEPGASRVLSELEDGTLHTTVISRFELLSGAKSAKRNEKIMQLLDALQVLNLDVPAADRAAEIEAPSESKRPWNRIGRQPDRGDGDGPSRTC